MTEKKVSRREKVSGSHGHRVTFSAEKQVKEYNVAPGANLASYRKSKNNAYEESKNVLVTELHKGLLKKSNMPLHRSQHKSMNLLFPLAS